MAMEENTSGKLSTDSYKGVRDFYPRDMYLFNYITDTMQGAAERFGFEEYSTSVLESTELYSSKTSEEMAQKETYTFVDRGGRSVTLRPEMTPSVARLIAKKRREITFPVRWYSIPNCFRYERPQKGRLREHWQLNCDIFGYEGTEADAEIIALAHHIMKSFGATEEQFTIKVNNRSILLKTLLTCASQAGIELSESQISLALRVMDKKEKLSQEEYATEMRNVLGEKNADLLLQHYTPEIVQAVVASLPEFQEFMTLLATLEKLGITNIEHDSDLVRGFDYYTGTIFEVFDTSGENTRSLFGGGRYDNLLDLFGSERVPAVGFGMGDVRISDFLETHNLLPEYTSTVDIFIATIGAESKLHAMQLAQELRSSELNVRVNVSNRKLGDQIKIAHDAGIHFLLIVGEDEIETQVYKLKHLPSSSEQEVARADISTALFEFGIDEEVS